MRSSTGQRHAPVDHHTALPPMTNAERAVALFELYQRLDELITAEEMDAYPFLDHLSDLIEDLEDDA